MRTPSHMPLAFTLVALVASGGLAMWLYQQRVAAMAYSTQGDPTHAVYITQDMIPDVTQSLRTMKLVTVEFKTRVTSTSGDGSIFGGVSATVSAPVVIRFGVELSTLESHALLFSPIHKSYLVTIPPPIRIATEVLGQFEEANVTTGWLRNRSSSGEYYLGLARRDMNLRAQELTPDDGQTRQIRADSISQVQSLVRSIVGPDARVMVRIAGGGGS